MLRALMKDAHNRSACSSDDAPRISSMRRYGRLPWWCVREALLAAQADEGMMRVSAIGLASVPLLAQYAKLGALRLC